MASSCRKMGDEKLAERRYAESGGEMEARKTEIVIRVRKRPRKSERRMKKTSNRQRNCTLLIENAVTEKWQEKRQ